MRTTEANELINSVIESVEKSGINADKIIVTESGIFTSDDVKLMQDHHVNTFLIGEAFMRESDPGHSLKTLFQF